MVYRFYYLSVVYKLELPRRNHAVVEAIDAKASQRRNSLHAFPTILDLSLMDGHRGNQNAVAERTDRSFWVLNIARAWKQRLVNLS